MNSGASGAMWAGSFAGQVGIVRPFTTNLAPDLGRKSRPAEFSSPGSGSDCETCTL